MVYEPTHKLTTKEQTSPAASKRAKKTNKANQNNNINDSNPSKASGDV